jgi:hypothetical protein
MGRCFASRLLFSDSQERFAEEAPCVNALEYDAYTTRDKYWRECGLVPEFDAFTVAVRNQCGWE